MNKKPPLLHSGVLFALIRNIDECNMVYDFESNDLAHMYTFDDKVPVAISGGDLVIDFGIVQKNLEASARIEESVGWILRRNPG